MNLCILIGRVINEVDLKFIYKIKEKHLDKEHNSIVIIELESLNKQIIKLHAYDEMADFIYQSIKQGDIILIEGKIHNDFIEIKKCMKLFNNT